MSHATFEGTARASDHWLIIGPVVLMTLWIGLCAWSLSLLGGMSHVANAGQAAPPVEARARIAAASSAAPDLCPLPTDRVSTMAR